MKKKNLNSLWIIVTIVIIVIVLLIITTLFSNYNSKKCNQTDLTEKKNCLLLLAIEKDEPLYCSVISSGAEDKSFAYDQVAICYNSYVNSKLDIIRGKKSEINEELSNLRLFCPYINSPSAPEDVQELLQQQEELCEGKIDAELE